MWLLTLEVLRVRWRLALAFFIAGGLLGLTISSDNGSASLGTLVPHFALGGVGLVAFGGLHGDEREKRNLLYTLLPLSARQAILARILFPVVLLSAFLPIALIFWALFNWHMSLKAGLLTLLAVHAFLLMMFQFMLFWEETKVYFSEHWGGRFLYWFGPLFLGTLFGGFFSSSWQTFVLNPIIIVWFYVGFLLLASVSYVFFLKRKDYTF